MDWLKYANQGAIRNKPLSPELVQALSFLPEMGIGVEVFSGGQDHKGHGHQRTGSTRHDGGGSGDVFFYDMETGDRLNWANPEHVPKFQDIVRQGKQAGLTGFGAGPGYMREGSMHIGFGAPAVWGDNGKGGNAPAWLREAYSGAPAGSVSSPRPPQPNTQQTAAGPLHTGADAPPEYNALSGLHTGARDGRYDGAVNALAAIPEPIQQMMAYNALANMFQPRERPEHYQLTGY